MPDYFVPLDTTLNSHYLNELYTSSAIHEYTFNYADDHRDELRKKGFEHFQSSFRVSQQMIDELVKVGLRNKVKPDYRDLRQRRDLFEVHIKAQVARKVWGNEGFYPVFNNTNEVFLQAIKLFEKIPSLDRKEM
jgi:carboxyl-terminal processing protease